MWSNFTNINNEKFINNKYILPNDNLIKYMKDERTKILSFNKDYNITIKKIKDFNHIIKDLGNTSWVESKKLMADLVNLPINIVIKWNNNSITVKCKEEHIKTFIKRVNTLINMIEYLKIKSDNTNKSVNIFLVLSTLEKNFPENNIMGVANANTGYTDFSNNIIFIWRYEEFEKVIFHEIIHYFNMDCKYQNITKRINIDGPHDYIEAITDYFGIIYNIIYLSILTKNKIKNLMEIELAFIRNQAYMLNRIYDLGVWQNKPQKVIKQKTGAFSYYIIKYLLFTYVINNNIIDYDKRTEIDFNKLLDLILINGMPKYNDIIEIKSSRMTLLQLK
jgi:hypothetical protein